MSHLQDVSVIQIPALINFYQSMDDEIGATILEYDKELFLEGVRATIQAFVDQINEGATRQYLSVNMSSDTFIVRTQVEPIAPRFAR